RLSVPRRPRRRPACPREPAGAPSPAYQPANDAYGVPDEHCFQAPHRCVAAPVPPPLRPGPRRRWRRRRGRPVAEGRLATRASRPMTLTEFQMSIASRHRTDALPHPSRRRFVQGLAAGGAVAAFGLWPKVGSALGSAGRPQVLSGTDFDLSIGEVAANYTGRVRPAVAVNGSIPAPLLRWR